MNKSIIVSCGLVLLAGMLATSVDATGLTVSGISANSKTYDGTNTTTVNFAGAVLEGVASGDVGSVFLVTNGYTATFSDKNVGDGKAVTVGGLTLTGSAAPNYTLTQPFLSANISPYTLTVTATGVNKTYDATINATVDLADNSVSGDDVIDFYDTASFANKSVGTNKPVSVTGIFLLGTDAGNYTLADTSASTVANIAAKTLFVGATGLNKPYDGTNTATVNLVDNHIAGDTVTDAYALATFSSQYVGEGISITVTGISISGADAVNYTLNSTSTHAQANITPRPLTVTATGQNKAYDGTTNATVGLADNRLTNDDITVSYDSAGFSDKNIGTNKTVTVYNLVITGPDSDSYTPANPTVTTTANISSRVLTVSAAGQNKTYDGGTNATVTLTDNRVAGDNLTDTYASASFSDKNVGNGKTVSVSGITLSGPDAVNYTQGNTTASTPANITADTLTVTATAQNKAYDGATTATVTLGDNRVGGDSLTTSYTSANFSDKNVGTNKTVTVTGIQIGGGDAGNYTLSSATASTTANISGLLLTVGATGVNKTYDGGTNASVTLSDNRVAGDSLTVSYTGASFSDKNAGSGKTITVTGISISGGSSAGNYTLATNTAAATATINARSLTVAATGVNLVYNGATAATVTLSGNQLSGDVVTLTYASATFASPYAGTGIAIAVTGIAISGGADGGNYFAGNTTASTQANITSRTLTVTATGVNKTYDGTTNATVTLGDDRLNGDSLTVSYSSAGFGSKRAGTNLAVTVTGLVLTGADADSYQLASNSVTTTANISSRDLTVVATGVSKVYDGALSATVTLTDTRLTGDNLTNLYTSATFGDKNVGNGKTITVTGITTIGPDAGNYSLANTTAATQASITNRSLTVTATGVNKVYDGTTNATVTLSDTRVSGDSLTSSYSSAYFADANAGTGKAVKVVGIQVTGNDAANYTLAGATATTTANITGRPLTVAATGQDKTYDGTTNAAVTLSDNRLAGDVFTDSSANASFSDKRVGSGKTVTVTGLSISGGNAANYTLAATNTSSTASITARTLDVTATGINKVYDGTTTATVTLLDNRVAGDVLTASYGSASFTSSTVGSGKTVNVSDIYLSGTDAGNYTLGNTTASTTASILQAAATLGALASSENPSGFHDAITFTETLPSDATGTVAYLTNGAAFNAGSLAAGSFTSTSLTNLPRGTNVITAIYSGDGNYAGTTNLLSQIVTNHPPIAGFFSVNETNGIALKVKISDLLGAVVDPDGDPVSLVSVNTSTNGMVVSTNLGYIIFRNSNHVNDQFSYVVTDGQGGYTTGQVEVVAVLAPFTGQIGSMTVTGGANTLTYHGIPFYTYVIQRSVNLVAWVNISTNTAAPNGLINATDNFTDLSGPPASAFYRLTWQP